jgi:LmbE family N-acetylglucosaminyl deacetylase
MADHQAIERVLVVTAHPDDAEFTVGGTVASFTAAGIEVAYCVITDGDAGGIDRVATRTEVGALRRREQVAAAAVLGVGDVRFLGYTDGELVATLELRRDISRVIRQVRPHRMLIHSPERNWDRLCQLHPDHLAAADATMAAIYPDARNPFAHQSLLEAEGLAAWTVGETWMFGSPMPNHRVDVTVQLDQQLAALREHHSQTDQMADLVDSVTGQGVAEAARAGLPAGHRAEAFLTVNTR